MSYPRHAIVGAGGTCIVDTDVRKWRPSGALRNRRGESGIR